MTYYYIIFKLEQRSAYVAYVGLMVAVAYEHCIG